jgi:hypothetical protein
VSETRSTAIGIETLYVELDVGIKMSASYFKKGSLVTISIKFKPVLLQDYFCTISGTISSTTNSTKMVPETSKKKCVFGGGFRYYSWYYLWYYFFNVIMSCDQDKMGTGMRFLVDARCSRHPCRLSPLAFAAAIIATFSTAAFS